VLNLTPVEPPPTTRRPGAQLLTVVLLLVVAIAAVGGVGVIAYTTFLMPTTDRGTCFVLDQNQCTALSASRIEAESGVSLPAGTRIVESSSGRHLKAGSATALVELPADAELALESGYRRLGDLAPGASTPGVDKPRDDTVDDAIAGDTALGSAVRRLDERGIRITGVWQERLASGLDRATVVTGADDRGREWAYVVVTWDG